MNSACSGVADVAQARELGRSERSVVDFVAVGRDDLRRSGDGRPDLVGGRQRFSGSVGLLRRDVGGGAGLLSGGVSGLLGGLLDLSG